MAGSEPVTSHIDSADRGANRDAEAPMAHAGSNDRGRLASEECPSPPVGESLERELVEIRPVGVGISRLVLKEIARAVAPAVISP
jgi:hypothetical protein